VHALVTRGSWDRAGQWAPVQFVDGDAAALAVRHGVFSLLHGDGPLSEERVRLLLSWRHSGSSAYTSVTVPPNDREGLERLARYLLRPPVGLEQLPVDEHARAIAYAARAKPGLQAHAAAAPVDPNEFLARVVMHIPDPRRHVIRHYGGYSSVVRARQRPKAAATTPAPAMASVAPVDQAPANPEARVLRRQWAELLRRSYEVDPLVCPRCGAWMRIVAFITEPERSRRSSGTLLPTLPISAARRRAVSLPSDLRPRPALSPDAARAGPCPAGLPGTAPPLAPMAPLPFAPARTKRRHGVLQLEDVAASSEPMARLPV
jgi:hypothetical protein